MNYKAKKSGEWERTYLMWGDEVEDDGNGVPGQCFCCSLLLLVSSFLLCSLFSLVLSSFLWSSLPCLFLESAACKRRWWCGRVVPPTLLPLLCFSFPLLSGLFSSLLRLSPCVLRSSLYVSCYFFWHVRLLWFSAPVSFPYHVVSLSLLVFYSFLCFSFPSLFPFFLSLIPPPIPLFSFFSSLYQASERGDDLGSKP